MGEQRFDAWTRALGAELPRRGTVTTLAGATVLAMLHALGMSPVAAKKGTGTGKKKGTGKKPPARVLVCHNGETLSVPRSAVRGVLLDGGTEGACPPAAGAPQGGTCAPLGNICTVFFGNPCCDNAFCTQLVHGVPLSPTFCMSKPCDSTAQCAAWFPEEDVSCEPPGPLGLGCPALADACCRHKDCRSLNDCPKSGFCCVSNPSLSPVGQCCKRGQQCTNLGCL